MRHVRACLLSCVALAACGDNNQVAGDARQRTDAAQALDAPAIDSPVADGHPDAPVDAAPVDSAPVDATLPAGPSRVWVVGDFLVNNTTRAGGFDGSAALPIVPPTLVPSTATVASASLGDGVLYTPLVFDVTPDGTKSAFVADPAVAGRFDLYVADASGGAPTLLVTGLPAIEISQIAISPDGTKVAYLADSVLDNGGYDLYVVATSGTGVPVRVSPDRAPVSATDPNLDAQKFVWSADSALLAFTADIEVEKLNEVYIVDTTVQPPTRVTVLGLADIHATPTATADVGEGGPLAFDNQNRVYFRAQVSATTTRFQLFRGDRTGARQDLTGLAPTRTADASSPDIGTLGVTPDGATLVFAADAPVATRYELYKVSVASAASATRLTALTQAGHPDFGGLFAFSPDSTKVAFGATYQSAREEPYVLDLTVGAASLHRLVSVLASCAACASPDINVLQWLVDGSAIYATGDIVTNNDTKLYRLDPTATDQSPTLAVDFVAGGDATNVIVRPAR